MPQYIRVGITFWLTDGAQVMGYGETIEEAEISVRRQVEYYAKEKLEPAPRRPVEADGPRVAFQCQGCGRITYPFKESADELGDCSRCHAARWVQVTMFVPKRG
jgi:hypothetical protein